MKAYRVTGTFQMGEKMQPFTIETVAESKEAATHWALSIMGSRHHIKRRQIKITDVHSEKASEVENAAVQFALTHEEEYQKRKAEGGHV